MDLKYKVDERAIRYYINKVHLMDYLNGNTPQSIDEEILKRKWNAMVEAAFLNGTSIYPRRNAKNEYKIFMGNFKFTVNTDTNTIRFVDHESFINANGEKDFNVSKARFDLDIAESLKSMYKRFGLNVFGNRLILS